jgi:glucose/mannose-6-phosphate isomerase
MILQFWPLRQRATKFKIKSNVVFLEKTTLGANQNRHIMKSLIESFADHLRDALEIGNKAKLKPCTDRLDNVLIAGMGGSGIGGSIISEITDQSVNIPVFTNKSYKLPNWVGPHTLVIISSYSGNTEETVAVMKEAIKRNSEIAVVTSGGYIGDMAYEKGINHILIPGGNPPRSMLSYSLVQLFILFRHYKITDIDFETEIRVGTGLIEREEANIRNEARTIAKKLKGKIPIIYAVSGYGALAERFRQQLNENSKMLCWHHVIPEMNHNELVGWAGAPDNISVVVFRSTHDEKRNQQRIEINKEIFAKHTKSVLEIWTKGDFILERILYLIHLTDWVSLFIAESKKIDPVEVDVIDFLKGELSKTHF